MKIDFLKQAIELAQTKMQANKGGPFGAVVVRKDKVIGEGWNQVTSANDPTAHAEVQAIRSACTHLNTFDLSGCEIYSSCEPCPMCLAAILWARLDALHYAGSREDAAEAGFDDSLFYEELAKPEETRQLLITKDLRKEAQAVFELWKEKSDKVEY